MVSIAPDCLNFALKDSMRFESSGKSSRFNVASSSLLNARCRRSASAYPVASVHCEDGSMDTPSEPCLSLMTPPRAHASVRRFCMVNKVYRPERCDNLTEWSAWTTTFGAIKWQIEIYSGASPVPTGFKLNNVNEASF